ncbi:MAG: PrsW family intramembrane metalloprotease [Candidatus Azambacteria bacterium]|nr:PrsW family intramembrane metalloprotease [Candidatus Azambacteria bacterium]
MLNQEPSILIPTIILAILPSLIWLFFYLREDDHPEPRYWLFTVFLMGVALAPLVIFLEMVLSRFFGYFELSPAIESVLLLVFIAPIVEEASKYGAVHLALNKNPILDEPVDGMIYVITAALGFAAIENIFAIFSYIPLGTPGYVSETLNFVSLRFISAVALHGLASGIAGYFFAVYYFIKKDARLILVGLFSAVILHGIYNFLITNENDFLRVFLTGITLGGAAALVIFLFHRLKHYKTYQQVMIDEMVDDKI